MKYLDLISNPVILHNVIDMSLAIRGLLHDGRKITTADTAALSPYLTLHIKRFGDSIMDLESLP